MRPSSHSTLLIVVVVGLLVCPPPLMTAVIVVDGTCTLVDAMTAANSDTATGDCPAGSGADEIELTVDVTLTAVDNDTDGPNGLPSVASEMTIRSSDASLRTIERDPAAPDFRILRVGSTGNLSLAKVVVSNGYTSLDGGGIFNRAQLSLNNSTVLDNSGGARGGGILNKGSASLTNSTVSGNTAGTGGAGYAYGGAVFNTGPSATLTLTSSTVSGNSATVSPGYGGGISNDYGIVTLNNSTVSGNFTAGGGGGIYTYSGNVSLTNSTVSGNSASFEGGGIYTYNSTVTLIHSTVSGNSASNGGAFYATGGTATLTGSLVANSPIGDNCAGTPVTDGGKNLADDATCGTIPDDLTDLDPVLADNGGPTMTHALLPGSNAIDLGDDCGLPTDQRLASRYDGNCDSGSYEFGSVPGEIFSDGFESGDTSAWSASVP